MAQVKKSENVPKAIHEKYKAIVEITDSFSKENLNDEYAKLIRYAVAVVCRKRPSPVETGNANTWACGVTHAIGMVNFLFDKSQTPHISVKELYKKFGVGESTGNAKSKTVRDQSVFMFLVLLTSGFNLLGSHQRVRHKQSSSQFADE